MIRDVLAIFGIGALLAGALFWWLGNELTDFETRCEAVGGHTASFSTEMSGRKCLTEDGRVIKIEGPGL
jgi:hypothetical protein